MKRPAIISAILLMSAVVSCSGEQEEPKEAVEGEASADEAATPDAPGSDLAQASEQAVDQAVAGTGGDMTAPVAAPPAAPPQPTPPPAVAPSAPYPEGKHLWVFVDAAAVRAEPKTAAAKVGKLNWGEMVEISGEKGSFVKVGEGRWVLRRHLTDRKAKFHYRAQKPKAKPAH